MLSGVVIMRVFKERLVQIKLKWFVETRTGYDGPFDNEKEAKKYLKLLRTCDAARSEFAGLDFSPL